MASYEQFRGTGGSLYFLRHQDVLGGSERVRIELRDKVSGVVTGVVNLRPDMDYDIDYLQGRLLLSEPLSSTADDNLLVRSSGLGGDEAWLVVRYEFTPGFDELDAVAVGGQGQFWFNDHVKLGLTASNSEEGDADNSMNSADLTLRKSAETWLKMQAGRSEGLVSGLQRSDDGGFGFTGYDDLSFAEADAGAYRADVSVGVGDFLAGREGLATLYVQSLECRLLGPGACDGGGHRERRRNLLDAADDAREHRRQRRPADDRPGARNHGDRGECRVPVDGTHEAERGRPQRRSRRQLPGRAAHAGTGRAYGCRPAGQLRSGHVMDAATASCRTPSPPRATARTTGGWALEAPIASPNVCASTPKFPTAISGRAGALGSNYLYSESTNLYLNYALENERADNGLLMRRGNLVSGVKRRLSDSSSVYFEERYQDSGSATGLTHASGVSLAAGERWDLGANADVGTLTDSLTGAETDRVAGGVRIGYGFENVQFSSAVEYRIDEAEQLDTGITERTTWLLRNSIRYQLSPDWRLIGKLNHAVSESSLGEFYDGGYTEAVVGYAYRPVNNDRLNALAKYTYFSNVPTTDQITGQAVAAEFVQKSHIAAVDVSFDLTDRWTIGGKYAYRLGQMSLDREDPEFFDNSAHLALMRADWRFLEGWEGMLEVRALELPDLDERRSGALIAVYRYLGGHFKVGVGYNFTDFSEELTDLSYDHQGAFLNMIGVM